MIPRRRKVSRYPVTFSACYSKKNKQYPYSRKIGLIALFPCRSFFHYYDDSLLFSPRFLFIADSIHTKRYVCDEAANIVSAGLCASTISFYHKKSARAVYSNIGKNIFFGDFYSIYGTAALTFSVTCAMLILTDISQREGVAMVQKLTMGEKLKDLRTERGLTTKEVCRLTGVSENIYNGLENDIGRDTGYSRIIALARFYNVPTDYLLGFTESRITRNVELNELGLSDKAIAVLLSKKQSPELVSRLIEHPDFTHLINAIDVYVRQIASPNIEAVNDMTRIVERGIEGMFADASSKPEGYADAMRFMDETVVNEDEFLRYRITERFNQILRDVYREYAAEYTESAAKRSAPMKDMAEGMLAVLDKIKSGEVRVDSVEDAVRLVAENIGTDDSFTLDIG